MRWNHAVGGLLLLLYVGWLDAGNLAAQSRFELSAPTLNRTSQAELSDRDLRVIDQEGRETVYARHASLDTDDGQYLAYRSGAGQVIRWPAANSGSMQIGTNVGGRYEFRVSQMKIVALDRPRRPVTPPVPVPPGANDFAQRDGSQRDGSQHGMVLPPGARPVDPRAADGDFFAQVLRQERPQPQVMRLTVRDDRGRDWYLGKSSGRNLVMHGAANPEVHNWYIVPAGRGFVRVGQQTPQGWSALTVTSNRNLVLDPLGQQAGQLWRVMQVGYGNGYWLECATLPGLGLTGAISGAVSLMPLNGGFGQVWWPQDVIVGPSFEPMWRTVSQDIRANPPLPPAQIELVNSHSEALRILVADRRTQSIRQVRVEPNSRVVVPFDRDAGATVVEAYELRGPGGVWDRQQFVTQIPPAAIYDLSVYEEFLQSIAIDRTGTSPNPIEDVNYQPKSVGWLPLPPGNALPDRGQIDAYQDAKAQNNPGAVRRFDPKSLEKPSNQPDPLKTILEDAAPKVRQKF